MNEIERDTIRRCIDALLNGPFLDDWEFHARLGVDRCELNTIAAEQARLDDCSTDSVAHATINNCMNEIVNGVNIAPAEWDKWFAVPRQEVQATFKKWIAQNP